MTANANTYKDLFEHETLDRISGMPSYESLHQLRKQLQANAASVPTTLGGGANGHLGLVLTPQQYSFISVRPFVQPLHPGILNIAEGTTRDEAEILKFNHSMNLDLFNTTHAVEKTLLQQLVKAIDSSYVEELRNQTTGLIDRPLHEVIAHLITHYGKVESGHYNQQYVELINHKYDPERPIDEIFIKIVDFTNLADATKLPMTTQQALHIGCEIIRQCGVLPDALKKWNARPNDEKTWENFKIHFRNEHKEYRNTLPTTANQTQYSANMIAQQVANQLWQRVQEVDETSLPDSYPPPQYQHHMSPPHGYQSPPVPAAAPPVVPDRSVSHQANAMVHDSTLKALMEQFKQLNTTVHNLQVQQSNQQYFQHQQPMMPPAGQRQLQPPPPPPPKKKRVKKYCWTHGLCNHDGFNCNSPAQGHNPYATKTNTMGGNNKGFKKQTPPTNGAPHGFHQQAYQPPYPQPPAYQQQRMPPPSPMNPYMANHSHQQFPPAQQDGGYYGYPPRYT